MFHLIPGPKRSCEVAIDAPVERVWEIVTDNENFAEIIQGIWWWGPFDRRTAGPGTSFKRGYLLDAKAHQWDYYIVNWEPLRRFSMGSKPSRWNFDFQLFDLGEDGTRLRCAMRFNVLGFLPFSDNLVKYTAKAVSARAETPRSEAC